MMQTVKGYDLLDARISIFNIRNLRHIDWVLSVLVLLLAVVGVSVLYSASQSASSSVLYYQRQLIALLIGLGLALVIICIDSRVLVWLAPVMYVGMLILLVAVIKYGVEAKGGQRWLQVGPLRLQPSEQSKLVLVFSMTWYLTKIKDRIQKFPFLLIGLGIIGVPVVLILKQPSLGTALVLVPVGVVMIYVAGCKWWHLALLAAIAAVAAPLAYPHLKPHQKDRIDTWIHPEKASSDDAWQPLQSRITVGSGGLSGKGYRQGSQTMLNYLPEHHTDFIFSLLAEEQGFIGAVAVIALFAAFFLRGLSFAHDASDMQGTILAVGAVTILACHVFVNIAITVGLMPVTGIPLPFLSYGRNFCLTAMMCVGVMLHVPVRKQLFE
ncbi:MAG: rod shape-determining protein RodA [Nitrospiraceae bacterium]|nr:rod shape-determining protein RodA [Nitrospiraceae bacterium]